MDKDTFEKKLDSQKFKVNAMSRDDYEGYAELTSQDFGKTYNAHYLVYGESNPSQYNCGDILSGKLGISSVSKPERAADGAETYLKQESLISCGVEAVVEVEKVDDSRHIMASVNEIPYHMEVGFEEPMDYEVGNKVHIGGFLELEIDED